MLPTNRGSEALEPVAGNYFVAVYPPFSAWQKESGAAVKKHLQCGDRAGKREPFGFYVHVPFCIHRCDYCYYLSYAGKALQQMEQYLDSLCQEVALLGGMTVFSGRWLSFVYFGGGTPSLLPLASLQRLFAGLQKVFPWTAAEEITFECAPRSITPQKLQALREAGVNRISFGVQQMNDEVLRRNGRVHLVADVERAWKQIQEVGFPEVNLDLIAGLVGETETTFRDSLERVIQLGPDSVTIYPLEIPPNTPLFRALQEGGSNSEVPGWPTKRERLAYAFARLEEAGYRLRSAYAAAKNGHHQRFVYQEEQYRGVDLLGLGVSSFSYVQGAHYQNVTSVDAYLTALREGELPISRGYFLSKEEQLVREFVLQLKLGRVELEPFRLKFGLDPSNFFARPLAQLQDQGWLTFDRHAVTMTRPGLLRVDRLLPAFYLPQHQGLRYW